MKAIVYTSQTGHTQRYAQMLAERTGVPAYSLKEAGKSLRRGEEIFYMGWLMAGTVKGLQSAMDRYTIRGAAIVGVSPQGNGDLWTEARINGGYSDSGGRLFYLQGGFDINRLKGPMKLIMKAKCKEIAGRLSVRAELNPAEQATLDMTKRAVSCVSRENLAEVIAWYK